MKQTLSRKKFAMLRARDVVLRVSWTGDADIDLSVEEPSVRLLIQQSSHGRWWYAGRRWIAGELW